MDDQRRNDLAFQIINALAPLTRRDEWWTTDGPHEAVVEVIRRAEAEAEKEWIEIRKKIAEASAIIGFSL